MTGGYHEYVFRDGRLVGDFERMYRESAAVPWHQDTQADAWFCDVAIDVLRAGAPYGDALDVGCGLGYFTTRLRSLCRSIVGVDVSETAVEKARRLHPSVEFRPGDIRSPEFALGTFDLVMAKDLFWYVFPDLPTVIRNLTSAVQPGGYLFLFQSFPALARPFVGKDIIPNPDTLLLQFAGAFLPEYSCVTQRHMHEGEGPMVAYLLRRVGGAS